MIRYHEASTDKAFGVVNFKKLKFAVERNLLDSICI